MLTMLCKKSLVALLVFSLFLCLLMSACGRKEKGEASVSTSWGDWDVPSGSPDDDITRVSLSVDDTEESENPEVLAENESLVLLDVISVTPTSVAVFGQLTEEAMGAGVNSVRITGSAGMEVQESCADGYFVIPVDLPGASEASFFATAMRGAEQVGESLAFTAPYDPTAESRLDGKNVSVGRDSRLYFSKYLDDFLGTNLYTASQLSKIKSVVASTCNVYASRAGGSEVAIIYVFLPDITTMDPGILREEDVAGKQNLQTRYAQIVTAVSGTKAKVVDMQTVLQAELDSGKTIYDLYRRTDSHPTEYTSFLMYREVMKYLCALDPDVVPRTIDEYTVTEMAVKGGDYVTYRGLDPEVITETVKLLTPTFDYQRAVAKIKLYTDPNNKDYTLFTDINSNDAYTGGAERSTVTTGRTELPNLLIYRDENGIAASLMIADSCDQTLLARAGDFAVSLTDAAQYRDKEERKSVADCIVVFVSESSIPDAFDNCLL
ncbi:MAG: hypothetical protein J1E00_05105 [Oscillospiraceae bacterium]|nr:hypothetical protein [Oscillospiraceae bacterium]